jgi:hypothetical protein
MLKELDLSNWAEVFGEDLQIMANLEIELSEFAEAVKKGRA